MAFIDDLMKHEDELIKTIKQRTTILGQMIKPLESVEKEKVTIPHPDKLKEYHIMNREKLVEIYGLIEQLVVNDKGERIVELCRHLDSIVKDYNSYGNLTHVPLIDLFKLLIENQVKGYKLLNAINNFPSAVFFADAVRRDKTWINIIAQSPEELLESAKKSLDECLKVI